MTPELLTPISEREPCSVLIVDDDEVVLNGVRRTLRLHGIRGVMTCSDGREVMRTMAEHPIALVLLDLVMPELHGEDLLRELRAEYPDVAVIVITATQDVTAAVRCMQHGAADYLVKPLDGDQLLASVERALEQSALKFEASRLREQFFGGSLEHPEHFHEIVTAHPSMLRLFSYLEAISRSAHPALIVGETGTGKELVARALHRAGHRAGPFVAVNVAGLDDQVFADTLFGHAAGAFTGADAARAGMVDRAANGTLFLDEIGDLGQASQVKLLRLLQEREYYPLGSDVPSVLRARVVTATHKDPATLRADLYYRLQSYLVRVPPLRDRLSDLPVLVDHFLADAARDLHKSKPAVPPELFLHLGNYDFPGNVRELQNLVRDAVARHDRGVMSLQLFLQQLAVDAEASAREASSSKGMQFPFPMPTIRSLTDAAYTEALRRVQGNRSAAARMLGVSRLTIQRRIRDEDRREQVAD